MKYLRRFYIAGLMFIATTIPSLATDAPLEAANAAFDRADGGDKKAAAEAAALFSELVKTEPDNPLLLVQLGAATAMQARATMLPWKKIAYAEQGMSMQDKAIALLITRHDTEAQNGVPISLRVRYVAANTFLAVPDFFKRKQQGNKLLGEVIASPLLNIAPAEFRGHVWMRAALYAEEEQRLQEARAYLNSVISVGAPQAKQARKELERMGL
jgi:hypothetical protein